MKTKFLYPIFVNKSTLIFGDKQLGFLYKICHDISPNIINEIFTLRHQNRNHRTGQILMLQKLEL